MKNGIIACIIILLLGVIYFFFKRSPLYHSVTLYIREIRWKGELDRKTTLIIVAPVIVGYTLFLIIQTPCTEWSTAALFFTGSFLLYYILKGEKDIIITIAFLVLTVIHWILAAGECTGLS